MFCRLHCHFFDNYIENMMSIRENAELFCAFHKDLLILLFFYSKDPECAFMKKDFQICCYVN